MEIFAALADPNRRRIVQMLADGPLAAGDIARGFDISSPAISQHLKVLRDVHLVHVRVAAQRRIYELDATGLIEINRWLAEVSRFWNQKLDVPEQLAQGGDVLSAEEKPL